MTEEKRTPLAELTLRATNRGVVTIPEHAREYFDIEHGTLIHYRLERGNEYIETVSRVRKDGGIHPGGEAVQQLKLRDVAGVLKIYGIQNEP